jgi:hypothetical protein
MDKCTMLAKGDKVQPPFKQGLDVTGIKSHDSIRVKGHDLIYRLPTMYWP